MGGDRSPGITEYLGDFLDGSLEIIVATHPHADHIGGLIEVLDDFDVDEIWLNGDTSTSKTYSDFMTRVNAEGAEVEEARIGDTIVAGNLVFDVLYPMEPLVDDDNSNSIVLRLNYGNTSFLFTGDAEEDFEWRTLVSCVTWDIDILKIAHHGSSNPLFSGFLSIVRPKVAIYMAGKDNTHGYPHLETIQALEDIGAEIYGTDVCGTITVTTDGTDYKVSECTP